MNYHKIKRHNIPWIILLVLINCCLFSNVFAEELTTDPNYHAEGWVNMDNAWYNGTDRRGCYISVYNRRTRKYSIGIYDRYWPDNIVIDDQEGTYFRIGDELECYAYTSYSGGKYWLYKDDELIQSMQATDMPDHFEFNVTITTRKTKVSCSASTQARNGEELSVTIISAGDLEKPTISMADNTIAVNTAGEIVFNDNVGVTGWQVTKSNVVPTTFNEITSTLSHTQLYTPNTIGAYYIWAKDALNNISDPYEMLVGNPPEPASRTVSGQTSVIVPYDVAIREYDNATFSLSVEGTSPLSFQWYRSNENSTTNGIRIVGATESSYSLNSVPSSEDGKYFYCVITNPYGEALSRIAKLTVYYKPVIAIIDEARINKEGDHYDLTVNIQTDGNTNNYSYQWFKAGSSGGTGSRIVGATNQTYRVIPRDSGIEWYYCEVYNSTPDGGVIYITTSNHVKIISDIAEPTISLGEFDQNKYISKNTEISIPVVIKEVGQGYTISGNFISSDVEVLVQDVVQSGVNCDITHNGDANENHYYTLKLSNITGNGNLSIRFKDEAVEDAFLNTSSEVTYDTDIIVDNVLPVISLKDVESGFNDIFISRENTLKLTLKVEDSTGMDPSEFTRDDIKVKVGGYEIPSYDKTLKYISKNDSMYSYESSLSNVLGDGELVIHVDEGRIKDLAGNGNVATDIPVIKSGSNIVVDNTVPSFAGEIAVRMDSDTSSYFYPSSLEEWHQNWSNRDLFFTVNAEDLYGSSGTGAISHYMVSLDNKATFTRLESNKFELHNDFNGNVWFRVFDKGGNYADKSVAIKLDKTPPKSTKIGIYESRRYGAEYIYKSDFPTNKTIYVYPTTPEDAGTIQSGAKVTKIISNGEIYLCNYTLIGRDEHNNVVYPETEFNFSVTSDGRFTSYPEPLSQDGIYEINVTTVDYAGNITKGEPYLIYIKKRMENTIRINNINDIGSGAKKLRINVFKSDSSGRKTSELATDEIIEENLYKDYQTTVTLGKGTFYVVAIIEDGVGLTWQDEVRITNNF